VAINFVDLYSEGDLFEFSSICRLFWLLLFRGVLEVFGASVGVGP
jgi:hypothetical protein